MKRALIFPFILLLPLMSVMADDRIMIMLDKVHMSNDTFELPIAFENDENIKVVSCAFEISTTGEAIAHFVNGGAYVAPDSRAYASLLFSFKYFPSGSFHPDTFYIVNWWWGDIDEPITPGPLEIMFYVPVFCGEYPNGPENPDDYIPSGAGEICIDSCTIDHPHYEWIWVLGGGLPDVHPTFNDDEGPHCIIYSDFCGDANADLVVNISDAVHIISYIFAGGEPPALLESGDADCSGSISISDAVMIIRYIFVGGNAPCDTNGDGEPNC